MVNWFKGIFRGAEAQPQSEQRTFRVIHQKPIGSVGTETYAGYTSEEYLDDLRGTDRAKIFDKMRRSDSQVIMCLSAVMGPILGAVWDVEPGDQNDEQAKLDAEFVKWNLFEGMQKTWSQFLEEALGMAAFGHAVFEQIDGVKIGHPKFGDVNIIENLAFRSQKTIERWNLNKETGALASITQMAFGDLSANVDIPAEFLLIFSLRREGSNYEGISLLRPVYGNWFRKNVYLKLNAIGIEKFAIPTPVVKVPNGKESGDQYENLISALEAYMAHEHGYLTIPEGWDIDLKTSSYDPEKVEVSIDNEDKRMVKAFLANFLELGMNGFGSQSLSFDLSDFFLGALDHVAGKIADEMNRVVIPRLVQLNSGERPVYPKLKYSGISDKAGAELAELLSKFAQSKIITPDDPLEANLRKRYNLPEKSDQGVRVVNPPQGPGAPSAPMLAEMVKKRKRVLSRG